MSKAINRKIISKIYQTLLIKTSHTMVTHKNKVYLISMRKFLQSFTEIPYHTIYSLYHTTSLWSFWAICMPCVVRLFEVPHYQMRTFSNRKIKPCEDRVCSITERHLTIILLPAVRLRTIDFRFTTHPIEASSVYSLTLSRIPKRFALIEAWIFNRLAVA